jgi:acyl-coenzyme A synthetase/AMP-(fatty) acid ligase
MAIIDFFDRGWRINPQAAAYLQDERTFSFEEVGELSCRIANALLAAGFGREAKGAVWAGNDVTAWTCTLGLWRAGMCWIPVGARNPAAENHFILDGFDCEVLFFQQEFAPAVAGLRATLPKVKAWICIDGEAPEVAGARSLQAWTAGQPATRPRVQVDMDDVVVL